MKKGKGKKGGKPQIGQGKLSRPKKDPNASPEHHAMNAKHGMAGGCCPPDQYEAGEEADNAEDCSE